MAFSWPSKGGIANYDYDRESAFFSRKAFLQVLDLLSNAKVSKVYVIAHSLGNQIVADALAHAEGLGIPPALSEVVFAAPDVDRDVFGSLIPLLISKAKGITLYASAADKALLVSQLKLKDPEPVTSLHQVRLYSMAWKLLTSLLLGKICLHLTMAPIQATGRS